MGWIKGLKGFFGCQVCPGYRIWGQFSNPDVSSSSSLTLIFNQEAAVTAKRNCSR